MPDNDVLLDFIHEYHDGNKLCTSYILIATLTDMDDSKQTDEFFTWCDPEQRLTSGIGLLEGAAAVLKDRFVRQQDIDD